MMKTTLVVLVLSLAGTASAQTVAKPGPILDELVQTHYLREVALSPDASKVAWTERIFEKGRDTGRTSVMWMATDGTTKPARVGEGESLAWAHDSRRVAWIDKQLYVATLGRGVTGRALTKLQGTLASPVWAPDDARLAVLYAEHNVGGGPLHAEPVETGVIGGAIHNQRITLGDGKSGVATPVSPADLHVYELAWSPDGTTFALTAAPGPGDNNWWTAKLYTLAVAGGAPSLVFTSALQIAQPAWAPDSKTIGFIEGLMSDEGATGGDLVTIASKGGAATNRTPNRRTTPNAFAWLSTTQLMMVEYTPGGSSLGTLDLATGKSEVA